MKSRAELDKEPRTMQFEVRSGCGAYHKEQGAVNREIPGFPVWVNPKINRASCGGIAYIVDDSSVPEMKARRFSVKDPRSNWVVCEHMGAVIE